MHVLLVQGTWGDNDQWWALGRSDNFAAAVAHAGHTLIGYPGREFCWSTNLGGWDIGKRDLKDWEAAGRHLTDYLDPVLCQHTHQWRDDLCIIDHSHGRQPTKFALHHGLRARTVIHVSGPIRADVDALTRKSRANVGRLVTLHGGRRDYMQILGEISDGHLGVMRNDPEADERYVVPSAGHSTLLNDSRHFHNILAQIRP